jgi:hypothetical protein
MHRVHDHPQHPHAHTHEPSPCVHFPTWLRGTCRCRAAWYAVLRRAFVSWCRMVVWCAGSRRSSVVGRRWRVAASWYVWIVAADAAAATTSTSRAETRATGARRPSRLVRFHRAALLLSAIAVVLSTPPSLAPATRVVFPSTVASRLSRCCDVCWRASLCHRIWRRRR